jgi:hypothetical protein
MQLAAANGQISTFDPEVIKLLGLISDASKKTGVFNSSGNPLNQFYVWQSPGNLSRTAADGPR